LHVVHDTAAPDVPTDTVIVPLDEGITVFPSKETLAVHASVRESVERIGGIGNEVGGRNKVVAFAKDLLANGAA
jgi:hypothetical protein